MDVGRVGPHGLRRVAGLLSDPTAARGGVHRVADEAGAGQPATTDTMSVRSTRIDATEPARTLNEAVGTTPTHIDTSTTVTP